MGPGGYAGVYGMGGPAPPGYPQAPASPGILRQTTPTAASSPSRTSPPPHSSAATPPIGMGFPSQRAMSMSSSHDPFSGPMSMASHSRQASQSEQSSGPPVGSLPSGLNSYSGPSSMGSDFRAIQRPGPIGRPSVDNHGLESLDEVPSLPSGMSSALRSSSPDNVFGSSALSPDDEIVPRRPSQHVAAPIWGGAPGGSVGSGVSAPSPWGAPSPPGSSSLGNASPFGSSPQPAAAALAPGSISGIWSSPAPANPVLSSHSNSTWGTPSIPFQNNPLVGNNVRPDPFGAFGGVKQPHSVGSSLLSPPGGGRTPALMNSFNLPSHHQPFSPPQPSR